MRHATQTIHTCNRMRNRCLHAHGGKCGAELTVVGGIRQCEVGQNSKLPVSLVSASTAVQRPNITKFSFQIATDDQAETDRYWNAIVGNGGQERACGWCTDKWGISRQITPRVLTEAMAVGGAEAKRAFDAMMTMKKIDVAAIKAARRG